jgi:hypothetical protein
MILKPVKQTSTAAALKAERDRDMAQAMQDYENEQCARLANMARLRALRLEKERAESKAAAPRSAKKKKAATETGRLGQAERFEPVGNLLHRGHQADFSLPALLDRQHTEFILPAARLKGAFWRA